MDPDGVAMSEVEPVSVEGGQVEQIMTVGMRPSVVDARVPHMAPTANRWEPPPR